MTERKIEMETQAKASLAKLPKLKITPFKGTAADWVRLENMFITQVMLDPSATKGMLDPLATGWTGKWKP